MASDVVRAAPMSTSILEAWWFRLVVRAVLAMLAFLMLRLSADQLRTLSLGHSVDLRFDTSLWLESIGSTVAAGLLFGLATWFPFTKVRPLAKPFPICRCRAPARRSLLVELHRGSRESEWMARSRLLVRQLSKPVRVRGTRGGRDRVRSRD